MSDSVDPVTSVVPIEPTTPAPQPQQTAQPITNPPVAPQPATPQLPQLERWETLTAELLSLIGRLRSDWDQSLLREYLDKRSQAPTHVVDQILNKRQP